ncbi:FCD domain-containing protein [Mycobacterium sp. ACS4331]|uniref:FadR/GntR family transcriptional regulator n=1 Tax=Mycobacterium sp. ACS4331 TaxID=1834121 RepID=UPI0007FC8D14|nr:FCD domain-containing protein [Mycobacterium sp. ACS4331]OBF12021.1 GntR family transcriptional regulator [Mycobacterium sp. ACS4331]
MSELIAPRIDSRKAKLAGRAAEQIVSDVIELGWPVGHVLGSESELLERYGVSRAVLREAVRLVEHQRVARMRRGTGGGLVIDEPDIEAVIGPAIIYLLRVDATLDEIFDTRILLEELAAEIASQRAGESDIPLLRATLEREAADGPRDHRRLHSQIAALTLNPVLELFVETFSRVSNFYFADEAAVPAAVAHEVQRAHDAIAKAVLANNPGLARERMRRHLHAEGEFIRAQPDTVQRLDPAIALAGTVGDKRGEALARQLFTEIVSTGAQPGAFLGSETTLMERHQASRAVVREAIRILEYHQIALTRRGPGGGLFVAEPDSSALADVITIYLRRRGIELRHITDLRTGLELAVVERAAARLSEQRDDDVEALQRSLHTEAEQGLEMAFARAEDFHSMLARLTGNRALELVHRVTMRLGWQFYSEIATANPRVGALSAPAVIEPAHQDITDALVAGDAELAIMRMRAHMVATASPS